MPMIGDFGKELEDTEIRDRDKTMKEKGRNIQTAKEKQRNVIYS